MFQRILVPTDGSRGSRIAVRAAVEVARMSGGSLVAVHVVPPVAPDLDPLETDLLPSVVSFASVLAEPVVEQHDAALGEVRSAASDAGVPLEAIEQRVDAQAASAIVDVAEERACDLIVMASHGYGDMLSIVVGSTTAKVVAGCDVPVLVVH